MTTKLKTAGSKNTTPYFELSGIRSTKNLNHTPFLVFQEKNGEISTEIVSKPEDLLKLPAKTKVMAQWRGKKKSDYFQFTVGQLRKHIAENPKHACQVI